VRIKVVLKFFAIINILNICLSLFVWQKYTKNILIGNVSGESGDLSRLGYIKTSLAIRKAYNDLPLRHYEGNSLSDFSSDQIYDVVTIGDSFSNGGGGGKNSYYQDYISTKYQKKVLNLRPIADNFLETIIILVNSGFFDHLQTKTLILESVERSFIERTNIDINVDKNMSINQVYNIFKRTAYNNKPPKYTFLNNGNYKFLAYNFLREYSDNGFFNIVYKMPLQKAMFSVERPNDLLFYGDDIKNNKLTTFENMNRSNNNLIEISNILEKHGIKLVVLVAPNKYTVYGDFLLQKNKYGKSTFFEDFSNLNRNFEFINSKTILQKAVVDGTKDMYYADDTHWSYKASELIIESMKEIFRK
jgi:hypothetical protein